MSVGLEDVLIPDVVILLSSVLSEDNPCCWSLHINHGTHFSDTHLKRLYMTAHKEVS